MLPFLSLMRFDSVSHCSQAPLTCALWLREINSVLEYATFRICIGANMLVLWFLHVQLHCPSGYLQLSFSFPMPQERLRTIAWEFPRHIRCEMQCAMEENHTPCLQSNMLPSVCKFIQSAEQKRIQWVQLAYLCCIWVILKQNAYCAYSCILVTCQVQRKPAMSLCPCFDCIGIAIIQALK